jgi:hypothetical protein
VWLTEYRNTTTGQVDTYDQAMLRAHGFALVRDFILHSDVVYEYHRQ